MTAAGGGNPERTTTSQLPRHHRWPAPGYELVTVPELTGALRIASRQYAAGGGVSGELTVPRTTSDWAHLCGEVARPAPVRRCVRRACRRRPDAAIILSKGFFRSDSANDYAHIWYISDQLFHHGRLPLHVANLESGDALTFPYSIAPWMLTAVPFARLETARCHSR
jgi:hypothetical protein